MRSFCKFKIGQIVTHSDIIAEFKCGNMGGNAPVKSNQFPSYNI